MKVVRKADVVIVNFDISGFHAKALLGAVLHLMYFETDGVDAAGNELHTVRTRTICCNTLPVADKISVDFAREDGTLFAKEVPTRMLEEQQELALSGHLWEIIPALSLGWIEALSLWKPARASCGENAQPLSRSWQSPRADFWNPRGSAFCQSFL